MNAIPGLPEIERRPLGEVKPSAENPRRINQAAVDAVAASLQRFGWQQPLVVDVNGELIVGHTRMLAAQALGEENAPVVVASDLSAEEARAYRIADNRTGEYSGWDYGELAGQLSAMDEDLAGVLGVADWAQVMAELDASQVTAREIPGLDEHTKGRLEGGVEYTLTFDTKDDAKAALELLKDAVGTCDIREKRAGQ